MWDANPDNRPNFTALKDGGKESDYSVLSVLKRYEKKVIFVQFWEYIFSVKEQQQMNEYVNSLSDKIKDGQGFSSHFFPFFL